MTTKVLGNSINVPKLFPLGCLVALVLLALSVGIVDDSGNLSNFRSWDFLISLMPRIYHFMYITTFGHYGNSKFLPTRVAPHKYYQFWDLFIPWKLIFPSVHEKDVPTLFSFLAYNDLQHRFFRYESLWTKWPIIVQKLKYFFFHSKKVKYNLRQK